MRSPGTTAAIFAALLCLYLGTACRDVYWFDSPEFTTTASNLDISHAPGYPLWNLLAHLFTRLPLGTVPFRVAAFSSFCAALAVALFHRFLLGMGLRPVAALAGALALGLLEQYWSLAVIAEVYALEMALLAGLLLSLAPGDDGEPMPNLPLSAFLAGCLVAHRPSDALFLPFLLGIARLYPQEVPRATLWFSLAYLPYLHTWWHLQNRFSMAYFDYPKDASTFFGILTGKLYANNLFTLSARDSLVELKNYLLLVAGQLGPVLLALGLAGLVVYRRRRRLELGTILGITLVNVIFCTNYNVIETNTMVLPSLAMICWLAAAGLDAAMTRASAAGRPWLAGATAAIVFLGLAAQLPGNYRSCDRSQFREVSSYLRDLHELLPQNAHILVATDVDSLAVLYGRFGLQRRKDLGITILDDWKPDITRTVEGLLREGKMVFSSLFLVKEQFDRAAEAFRLRRKGFLYRLELKDGAGPDLPGGNGTGVELSQGVRLGSVTLPARTGPAPELTTIGVRWEIESSRACHRPGAVIAMRPAAASRDLPPSCSFIRPVGGLLDPPAAGIWLDRYSFRVPPSVAPGLYRVELGLIDLCSVTPCPACQGRPISPAAREAVQTVDPAEVPGLDFWKERQMQYILAIREALPYHATSWSVSSWERLAASGLLQPAGDGETLADAGTVELRRNPEWPSEGPPPPLSPAP